MLAAGRGTLGPRPGPHPHQEQRPCCCASREELCTQHLPQPLVLKSSQLKAVKKGTIPLFASCVISLEPPVTPMWLTCSNDPRRRGGPLQGGTELSSGCWDQDNSGEDRGHGQTLTM